MHEQFFPLVVLPLFFLSCFSSAGEIFIEQQILKDHDASGCRFGYAVAISGNSLIVGAASEEDAARSGAAFVFTNNDGKWTQQKKILPDDKHAISSRFGWATAIHADTAVIGAPSDYGGGSVHIYTRSDGRWSRQQKLTSTNKNDKAFGCSLGLFGDTLVVGVEEADVSSRNNQGAAIVFVRNSNNWTEQQRLTASDGNACDHFGCSVGIYEETIIVGALKANVGGKSNQGAAYIFTRADATWSERQKLIAETDESGICFGNAVAICDKTAVVGAPEKKIRTGAAYIFVQSGDIWSQQQLLTAADGAYSDRLGSAAAISGDTVVLGAPQANLTGKFSRGAAYIFTRTDAVWSQQRKLIASDNMDFNKFGSAAALDQNTALVGAYANYPGKAYIFDTNCDSSPIVRTGPVACPNPVIVGNPVLLTVAAYTPDNDSFSCNWDFGDGSSGSASAAIHTYSAVRSYTAVATIKNSAGKTTTCSTTIMVADAKEASGKSAELNLSKIQVQLNFKKTGTKDAVSVSGLLNIPDGFNPKGTTAEVNIGGLNKSFVLDEKGNAKTDSDENKNNRLKIGVKYKRGVLVAGPTKFSISLRNGDFQDTLALIGFNEKDTAYDRVYVPTTIAVGGRTFVGKLPTTYKAQTDKSCPPGGKELEK
jgi:PKD repeat protein